MAAALAVSGCFGAKATPRTIYITLPPASQTPVTATPTPAPTPEATATAEDTSSAEPTATPTPAPTPASATPTVSSETLTSSAPDHRWTVQFRKPKVSGVTAAAVTAITNSITTRINGYISAFSGSGLPVVSGSDGPSTLNGDFAVAFVSPTLLSLRFTVETYITGAAHPSTEMGSLNFDVLTGAVIQFNDLFTSTSAALPVLSTQAHTRLTALLGADLLWPASVTMAFFGSAWVFAPGGLELNWSQSAIGPTAVGTPSISISWSALAAVIAKPGPAAQFVP
jgi:hypothetical protein